MAEHNRPSSLMLVRKKVKKNLTVICNKGLLHSTVLNILKRVQDKIVKFYWIKNVILDHNVIYSILF